MGSWKLAQMLLSLYTFKQPKGAYGATRHSNRPYKKNTKKPNSHAYIPSVGTTMTTLAFWAGPTLPLLLFLLEILLSFFSRTQRHPACCGIAWYCDEGTTWMHWYNCRIKGSLQNRALVIMWLTCASFWTGWQRPSPGQDANSRPSPNLCLTLEKTTTPTGATPPQWPRRLLATQVRPS